MQEKLRPTSKYKIKEIEDLKAKVIGLEAQLKTGTSGKGEIRVKLVQTQDHTETALYDQRPPPSPTIVREQINRESFAAGRVEYRSLVPDKLTPARLSAEKTSAGKVGPVGRQPVKTD